MTEDLTATTNQDVQSSSDNGEFERESVPENKLKGLRSFIGMYAVQLQNNPADTAVAPGPMAVNIAGLAGAVCVIIAGWTTASPTIYRARLALQIIFRRWSRFKVTLITGAIATVGAIFPALVMKLLDFVALYGMILMPMGTVIFIDFWVLPKLGMKRFYAELTGTSFNWAAGAAWV